MSEKQPPPHVQQALNELEGTGNEDQRTAARKRLAASGYEEAAQARRASTEGDSAKAARSAPQGRRAPAKQQG